ncbi:RNA-binding protein with multiple splicing 2 [Camellia lanceoleosa]|uniref:RNA-binding protein with multiple splicing 2 n=1 Tax=Camellia lanceoleosa TaxID=1840588 RepID=A0ACC0GH58_9ERIC|nr:RNA-binding protein with multiple splicing 2 [Camellia lanceoleosa]
MPMEKTNRLSNDEVQTIFISGLPEDVKERELQNLLRWLPSYEASQVNFKGEHPMGFTLFTTHFPIAAKYAFQEVPHHLVDILHPSEGMLLAGPDYRNLNVALLWTEHSSVEIELDH